jgi:hypothetical protein
MTSATAAGPRSTCDGSVGKVPPRNGKASLPRVVAVKEERLRGRATADRVGNFGAVDRTAGEDRVANHGGGSPLTSA